MRVAPSSSRPLSSNDQISLRSPSDDAPELCTTICAALGDIAASAVCWFGSSGGAAIGAWGRAGGSKATFDGTLGGCAASAAADAVGPLPPLLRHAPAPKAATAAKAAATMAVPLRRRAAGRRLGFAERTITDCSAAMSSSAVPKRTSGDWATARTITRSSPSLTRRSGLTLRGGGTGSPLAVAAITSADGSRPVHITYSNIPAA